MLARGTAATSRLKIPVRHFSVTTPAFRRLPHERHPLTNEQLAAFGGKKALQRRLEELGLSPVGFRAILRHRMFEHCEQNGQVTGQYVFPPKPSTLADIPPEE